MSLIVAIALLVASCSSSGPSVAAAPSTATTKPVVFVTMGAIETSNLDYDADRLDTWPQIVFAKAMPSSAVFVDLAGGNVTAERVIDTQLPELASLHPDVVTIWVEAADVRLVTPTATYQAELTQLIAGARRAGAHQVLLLTPPRSQPDLTGALAATVAQTASATGATLVHLDDTSDRESNAGQRRIAASVIAAIRG